MRIFDFVKRVYLFMKEQAKRMHLFKNGWPDHPPPPHPHPHLPQPLPLKQLYSPSLNMGRVTLLTHFLLCNWLVSIWWQHWSRIVHEKRKTGSTTSLCRDLKLLFIFSTDSSPISSLEKNSRCFQKHCKGNIVPSDEFY